jgi:gluconolactonase
MNAFLWIAGAVSISALLAAAASPPAGPAPGESKSPVAPGAKPVKLAGGLNWTEGGATNKAGNVYFCDQNNDTIHLWTFDPGSDDPAKGTLSVFMHPSGYANGMACDKDDNLIACADEKNELWSITPDKKVTVLIKDHQGKPMNGPNDVWIRPDGGMYLTDPLYVRTWWTARPGGKGQQQAGRYVYFFSPDRKTLTPVVTDFNQPNGIIGTPDGKTLYISDINAGQTWKYSIHEDGTLGDKTPFCKTGSDGMTIDDEGNVYTTSTRAGVQIWNKEGKLIEHLNLPSGNVCFAGKNRDILFVCAVHDIYAVKMRTHGVGPS